MLRNEVDALLKLVGARVVIHPILWSAGDVNGKPNRQQKGRGYEHWRADIYEGEYWIGSRQGFTNHKAATEAYMKYMYLRQIHNGDVRRQAQW